ncbi:hypothetical protein PAPHI01_0570 [Pancytospora philotis]|nr:hypothetical protein PAPHI01_0570 [Pancytospora philotis]
MRLRFLGIQTAFIAAASHLQTQDDAAFVDMYSALHADIGRSLQDAFETISEVDGSIAQLCRDITTTILEPWSSVPQDDARGHRDVISEIGNSYKALEARVMEQQRSFESALAFFDGLFERTKKLQDALIDYVAKNEVAFSANRPKYVHLPMPDHINGAPDKYLEYFDDSIRGPCRGLQDKLESCICGTASESALQRGAMVTVVSEVLMRTHVLIYGLIIIVFDMHRALQQPDDIFSEYSTMLTQLDGLVEGEGDEQIAKLHTAETMCFSRCVKDTISYYKVYTLCTSLCLSEFEATLNWFGMNEVATHGPGSCSGRWSQRRFKRGAKSSKVGTAYGSNWRTNPHRGRRSRRE